MTSTVSRTHMRRFELCDPSENHQKVWEVSDGLHVGADGSVRVRCRWGRIGTIGQWKDFAFGDAVSARAFRITKIREKINKGYICSPPTQDDDVAEPQRNAEGAAALKVGESIPAAVAAPPPPPDPANPFTLPWEE